MSVAPADFYHARAIKRSRRTSAQVEQLDLQIIAALKADHPQSVRHVFYLMTNPRLPEPVEKSDRGYRHVQHRLVELRASGRVPYGWVVDATRNGFFVNTFSGAADFVERMTHLYRADPWRDAEYRCEVWVESRSLASVLLETCQELAVTLYPSGGFASLSFTHDAAIQINEDDDGRPLHIFYAGDYDPAGVLIDRKIEEALRQHLDPSVEMTFERIGITQEQIEHYDLPTKPRKEGDRRALHIKETVEAEAMPAHIMRGLLRKRIEALLPENALHVAAAAQASERGYLKEMAQTMGRDRA